MREPSNSSATYVDLSLWLAPSPSQFVEPALLDRLIEMFRALGLRFILAAHNGQVRARACAHARAMYAESAIPLASHLRRTQVTGTIPADV